MDEPEQMADAGGPSLFRPEALEAARSRLGSPIRPVGVASWALVGFLLAIFATAAVFLVTARYARKETVPGVLSPTAGAVRVTPLRPGLIAAVHVKEGQSVGPGDPLITVSLDETLGGGGATVGALLEAASATEAAALADEAEAQQTNVARRLDELRARRAGLQDDLARLAGDRTLQNERVRLAEQTVEAARTLFDKQLLPAIQYRQREEALIAARQGLAAVERERARGGAALMGLDAEEARLVAEAAQAGAQARAGEARVAEKRAQLSAGREVVLTARTVGRVAALQAKPGAPAQPGATLAVVLPRGSGLEADLWVPSRAAGFVKPGDAVRLMYDAFPYQRFGVGRGRVREVGRAPVAPQDLPVPIETEESLYRITVTLDRQTVGAYGQSWALSPGMRLQADLVLDERPLMAWLLDPVLAIKERAK